MIIGFSGNLSGGKTVSLVRFGYLKGLEGKKIISNFKLNFPKEINTEYMSNADFIDYIKKYYENSNKLIEKFSNSVILLDEVVNLLSARKSNSALNETLTNFMMMLGKLNCDVCMSYQLGTSQLDNRVREGVLNQEGLCFRATKKGIVLDNSNRILNEQVFILIIWIYDFGHLGKKYKAEYYDPSNFFNMYDTREIVLMDRSDYIKGGKKDMTKKTIEHKTLNNFNKEMPSNDIDYFDFS